MRIEETFRLSARLSNNLACEVMPRTERLEHMVSRPGRIASIRRAYAAILPFVRKLSYVARSEVEPWAGARVSTVRTVEEMVPLLTVPLRVYSAA